MKRGRCGTHGIGEVANGNIETGGSIFCVRVVYQHSGETIVKAYDSIMPLIEVRFFNGLCEGRVRGN